MTRLIGTVNIIVGIAVASSGSIFGGLLGSLMMAVGLVMVVDG